MEKKRLLWAVVLPVLLCGAAWAGHPLDKEMERCMDEDPSTTGIIQCSDAFYEKWDAELNRVYKELMALLPKEGGELLRGAQRAWIPWRDREKELLDEVYSTLYDRTGGGTMWSVAHAGSFVELPRARALELLGYLEEAKAGKPVFQGTYPAAQTDEQLAQAMKVKNESAALGKLLLKDGPKKAADSLAAWEDFRNREVRFMGHFYGKTGDKGFPLHARMVKNVERVKELEGIVEMIREHTEE